MKFFNINFPLNVIKEIVNGLSPQEKMALTEIKPGLESLGTNVYEPLRIIADPEIDLEQIAPHVKALLPVTPRVPITLKRLTAGFSPWANSYLLQVGGDRFVLRHIRHEKGRAAEVLASIIYAEKEVAPAVEYFDYSAGIVIMRFVDNDPSLMGRLDDQRLKLMANKFKEIHTGPVFKRRVEVETTTLITQRRETLTTYIKASPVFFLQQYALMQLDSLAFLIKQTHYCHNDVNPNNLLATTDNVWFIDWECGGINDPFLDLATVVATLRLKSEQAKTLLEHYLGRAASSSERLHFVRMQQIALLRFAISFAANMTNPMSVTGVDIASIPAFNHYQPSDGAVDKSSDAGKFYISVMLIKQAMQIVNDYQFKAAIQREKVRPVPVQNFVLRALQIPYSIMGRILTYLRAEKIQTLRILSTSWKLFIDGQIINPLEQINTKAISAMSNSNGIATRLTHTLTQLTPWNMASVKPLAGGLSPFCQNFVVETRRQKYVVKVLAGDSPQGWVELYAAESASRQGIGPRMVCFNTDHKVAVFEYVPNDPRWPLDKSFDRLASLGSVISALHGVRVTTAVVSSENDKFVRLKAKVQKLAQENLLFTEFLKIISVYDGLDRLLNMSKKSSLCHYDMNPWNILYKTEGNQFSLIDWEFARVGNPFFDLATVANFLRLNAVEETFLLVAYAKGRVTALDDAHYKITKAHVYLRYAICSLGVNTSYEFTIDKEMVNSLPPFNQFAPTKFKVDKNTNIGRYYIAQMFVKAAMNLLMDKQFPLYIKTVQQGFNTDYTPSFFTSSVSLSVSENGTNDKPTASANSH